MLTDPAASTPSPVAGAARSSLLDSKAGSQPDEIPRTSALRLADRLEEIGTFSRQVHALRCCGLIVEAAAEAPHPLACHLRFCPICQARWRRKALWQWSPRVSEVIGESGEVHSLTLTLPSATESLASQKTLLERRLSMLFRKQAWKGSRGHIHRVGALLVLEVSSNPGGACSPHAHLLLAGATPGDAASAADWLLGAWLALNPSASRQAQEASPCSQSHGFGAWLNYILKGHRLDPTWDDARLEATAQTLLDRSHRVRALGLLSTRARARLNGGAHINGKLKHTGGLPVDFEKNE